MRRSLRIAGVVALGMLILLVPGRALASWSYGIEAGPVWRDNVGLAARAGDGEGDAAFAFAASVSKRFDLTGRAALTLGGALDALDFQDHDGLDRVAPGGSVFYRHKLGLGAQAPWLGIGAASRQENTRDERREGRLSEGLLRGGKRLGERWALSLEAGYEARRGENAVFDADAVRGAIRADVAAGGRAGVRLSYRIRRGDVTSSGPRNPAVNAISEERITDPVFGPGARTYRFDATAHAAEAGLNWALGRDASLEASYERLAARAREGVTYRSGALRLGFLRRF